MAGLAGLAGSMAGLAGLAGSMAGLAGLAGSMAGLVGPVGLAGSMAGQAGLVGLIRLCGGPTVGQQLGQTTCQTKSTVRASCTPPRFGLEWLQAHLLRES